MITIEAFRYSHFNSCHPPVVKKAFINLKTKQWDWLELTLQKQHLARVLWNSNNAWEHEAIIKGSLSGVIFASRPKANERILPFATTNNPVASNLKQKLMEQWTRVQNQSMLKTNHLKLTSDYIKKVYLLRMCLFDQNSISKGPIKDTNFKLTVIIFI